MRPWGALWLATQMRTSWLLCVPLRKDQQCIVAVKMPQGGQKTIFSTCGSWRHDFLPVLALKAGDFCLMHVRLMHCRGMERRKTVEMQRLLRPDPFFFQSQSRWPRPWTCMLASASFVSKIPGMCALGAGTAVCAASASRHSCSSHGLHVQLVDCPSQRATVRFLWARMSQQKNRSSILDRPPDWDQAAVRVGTWLATR